ncbi:hypothetical protein F0U60_10230 [Archangium minus]|uniref:Outer membrane protein beta-barrel domain-containing protein n=1 Tax=Archangium minus TaxID=83450 RepID=A0ABY9WKZ2_9BACT|nr:hypothetical protein F0U60_10230 [Archangium minus]
MIRSVLLIACLALPWTTWAAEEPAADSTQPEPARGDDAQTADSESKEEDTTIERHRTPFEVLNERMIGTASRAVRFDWRQTQASVGLVGSQLLELNNFKSSRLGGFVRKPIGDFLGEIAITRVFTRGSASTEKLALTPYRQSGRPSRFELDINLGYPLAEGVATARPGFFPATELVFSANAGLRYLFYPGSLSGASFGETVTSLFALKLSEREIENLERSRLPGMQLDGARYSLLTGLSLDVYFQSGGFLSPRVMIALPLISGVDGSGLGWWWELNFGAGWAF